MRLVDADSVMEAIKKAINQLPVIDSNDYEYINDIEEECENLSEYNRVLVERVKELEKQVSGDSEDTKRKCSCCGKPMTEGFVIDNGLEYYCSDECLCKRYAKDEYMEMYDNGMAYWTEWEE